MARNDNNWIQTFSGKQVWPFNMQVEDLDIVDIAHALALKCRFTGHCLEFYSVAQHCVIGSRNIHPDFALWFLLHDATEAYLPDVARPCKRDLYVCEHNMEPVPFKAMEKDMMFVIAAWADLPSTEPAEVGHMDLVMLRTERRDLMAVPPRPWSTDELAKPLTETIEPWEWRRAKAEYLRRFHELTHSTLADVRAHIHEMLG